MIHILNFLHRRGFHGLLTLISQAMYYLKGYGYVKSSYHPEFRAFEYRVNGITYLSMGPGWAYNFEYLNHLLRETYCYQYLPKAGDCVIDVGAGLGEEIVVYAKLVGESGKVHALEANPSTCAGLKYMSEQNKFSQVTVHHAAIYKTEGEVTIEDDEENYLTNTIGVPGNSASGFTVKAKTLDALVKENHITKIDFLKSNIEGAEQYLIEGMEGSIRMIRNMCISCHDFRHVYHQHGEFYMTKQKVRAFLESKGFEVTVRQTGNRVVDDYLYARNLIN